MLPALIALLLAAVLGITMAARIFSGKMPAMPVSLSHGALAASGLVLALLAVINGPASGLALAGVGVLVVAALGGFYLFSIHLRGHAHPRTVVVLHAVLAVTGVGCLALTLV